MIKAVFFDFDGTISDAKKIGYDSMVLALEDFKIDFDKDKLRELMGVKVHLILKELDVSLRLVKNIHKRFYRYFTEAAVSGGIRPCVSLKPLWEMKKCKMPMIIVSNSKTSFIKASIKTLKIQKLFDRIYGSDKFMTKNEMLKKMIKKRGLLPSEVIYVGDRFSDVRFAKAAGCVSVAIHNKCSWSTLDLIKREKPDYIIKDFYELNKIIYKINSVD
jgi:phosphoglycolate phosphatase